MKLLNLEQGSVEWQHARAGITTASEMDSLITPLGKKRSGEGLKSYLARKVSEAWLGGPLETFTNFDVEAGQILEGEARPWFECATGLDVKTVGFITTDDGRIGCSPDGLVTDTCGLEIKCPKVETHVGYLLAGILPYDYVAQVQGSMLVTGYSQWKFLSYRRRMPAFLLTVDRDEAFIKTLNEAIEEHLERFTDAMKRMEEINGAPRPKRYVPQFPETKPQEENYEGVTP